MMEKDCIPQGYKKTFLGIIPQEWGVKKVKDLCKIDAMSLSSSTMPNYEFDYISLSDVESNTLEITTSHQIFKTAPSRARRILKKDDVVISTVRPNLKSFFRVKSEVKDLIASTGFSVLSPYKCDSKFLLLYFFSQIIDKQFYSLVVGSNYPAVNSCDVANIRIAVPPIEEQKKIAELLSEWDKAIELQTKLIEKQELRKRAMMQRLLTGRVRLNGFSDKWQAKLLCELGTFEKGYGVPKEQIREKGHKAITYGEIYTQYDYVIKKFVSFIDDATAEISKSISCGAILFAGSGETLEDIGKCIAYVDNDIAYAGGDIIIFNPNPDINSLVLSYYLNSPSAIIQKRRYGQGHSVVHIYTKDLSKIKVLLPSLAEQTAIAEVLISADKEIEIAKTKLSSLRNQKRGLMQQLLTGKKRIK